MLTVNINIIIYKQCKVYFNLWKLMLDIICVNESPKATCALNSTVILESYELQDILYRKESLSCAWATNIMVDNCT